MARPDLTTFQKIIPIYMQNYERYLPTAFDGSLTLLEKINKVIEQMHKLGELSNNLLDKWQEVMEWIIGEGLETAVSEKLNEWLQDGTIDQIINENLFNDLKNQITALQNDKADKKNVNERAINIKYPPAPLQGCAVDGVTDDHTNFMAILRYAEANNYKLLIPGICRVTQEIEIRKPITIEGIGAGSGYADRTVPNYKQISGFKFTSSGANWVTRVRTRVNYRGSASDPQDNPIRVGLNIQAENVVIRDLSCTLNFAIDSPESSTNFGSLVDVGIFIGCRVHTLLENVHVIGYFREANIYQDVTRASNLPEFNDSTGTPFERGNVTNGSDGLTLIKVFTLGGKWGLKIQGAKPKAGQSGYSDPYYDEQLGTSVTDRRGNFGSSDVTAEACSFYGRNHHTKYRSYNATGNYLTDNSGGVMSIDGLAGNASGAIQGMRFISCRFSSWEPYRIKLDRVNRVIFLGCHSEWGSGALTTSGAPVKYDDTDSYGPISTTAQTTNILLVGFNSRLREAFINKMSEISLIASANDSDWNVPYNLKTGQDLISNRDIIAENAFKANTNKELDMRSGSDSEQARIRLGTITRFLLHPLWTQLYGHVYPETTDINDIGRIDRAFRTAYVKDGIVVTTTDGTKRYRIRVDNNGNVITQLQS